MLRLSDHFTIEELEATSWPIPNEAPREVIPALCYGVLLILEPLRIHLGCPVVVTSGYRSPAVNAAVGGVRNSQHLRGCAADIKPADPSKFSAMVAYLSSCPHVDQLLTGRGWLHVSWCPDGEPRNDVRIGFYKK